MEYEDDEAINKVIENLNRIPKDITSEIRIDKLMDEMMKELRRKISI
jgi:hypothetical protein